MDSYLQFAPPADGTYYVAVSSYPDFDFDGSDGESVGSYSISFQCQAGGSVSGTVTDAATALEIFLVTVEIFDENGDSVASVSTDFDGSYSFGLAAGTYFAATTNLLGYVDELYDNLSCPGGGNAGCDPTTGTPIQVTVGGTVSGIDFVLEQQQPDALEPNNSATEATSVVCDDSFADVSILPSGDVDFYGILLSAGEVLTIDIDAQELGSNLDSLLGIFDIDGTTLLFSSDDDSAPGETSFLDSYLEFTAPASGTYFVAVSSFGDSEFTGDGFGVGEYAISFQCQTGPATRTVKQSSRSKITSGHPQILKMHKAGFSTEEIAKKLKLSPSSVLRRLQRTGQVVIQE